MSTSQALLGLLDQGARHGDDLERAYDERFGRERELKFGQVHSTLSRSLRDGLVEVERTEPGSGPERERHTITEAGRRHVAEWLSTPERPSAHLRNVSYTELSLALLTGRDPVR